MKLKWRGKGINEKAYNEKGKSIIECDARYYRPTEVNTLLGNATKARKKLNWKAKTNLYELAKEMIISDYKLIKELEKI